MTRPARLALALLALLPAAALANPDAEREVKAHLEKGNALLADGEYEAAYRRFAVANSLVPEASGPYAGMGFALKGLGRCADALPNLSTYLRLAPSGTLSRDVKEAVSECEAAPARLALKTEPEGAAITVDNARAGQAPKTIELRPGPHVIEITKSGYEKEVLRINAEPGRDYALPLVTLTEAKGDAPAAVAKAPFFFSVALIPTSGRLAFAQSLGARVAAGLGTSVPLGERASIGFGGVFDQGVFKEGPFVEPTTRLAAVVGWRLRLDKTNIVRAGLDAEAGFLLHLNSFVDEVDGLRRPFRGHAALRLAPSFRFRLSPDKTLLFQPLALTVNPVNFDDLREDFNDIKLFEFFTVGLEQNL